MLARKTGMFQCGEPTDEGNVPRGRATKVRARVTAWRPFVLACRPLVVANAILGYQSKNDTAATVWRRGEHGTLIWPLAPSCQSCHPWKRAPGQLSFTRASPSEPSAATRTDEFVSTVFVRFISTFMQASHQPDETRLAADR